MAADPATPDMQELEAPPSGGDRESSDLVGADGLPLQAYRGWDEAAGVFRVDHPEDAPPFLREILVLCAVMQ